jgi:hypothetical protein
VPQQHRPGIGELHTAGGAAEQLHVELALQVLHLRAQRLLDREQPACRSGEIELLRHGDERAQVPQLEVVGHGVSPTSGTACAGLGAIHSRGR